tara:strand:- start:145 stop:573 length:429 start_codon:yes stop_codon:yes gene_type:complete
MPGSNPYELRLQLFQEAKSICWEEYNRNVTQFEVKRDARNDIKEKYYETRNAYESKKEEGKLGSMEYPEFPDLPDLPEYPEYPSMDEIKEKATFIRNFCDDKGINAEPKNWREDLEGEVKSKNISVAPHLLALKRGTTGISS